MTFDPADFRKALGHFATGVTVITGTFPDGKPAGVTVNAFSSLSLDPPLVLFCLGRGTSVEPAFLGDRPFTVHVLGSDQQTLSNQFARSAEDRFGDLGFETGANGCPLLDGCLARIICDAHAEQDGGDHVIKSGRVIGIDYPKAGKPLMYFGGSYQELA
ncbi:MAG: flavin reductase family protein [Magnetovibrionaceae bacterium]